MPGAMTVPPPPTRTVASLFLERLRLSPRDVAYRVPDGAGWATLDWTQVGARVRAISAGLLDLGLELEDRAAILCSTRIEWILCYLGAMCAGAAVTTVYPASTPDECAYILSDAGARVAFVEDPAQLAKLEARRADLPHLAHVVLISGSAADPWVITLADLEARGRALDARDPARFEARAAGIRADHLATIIYTSGTTGRPKGVELTHDVWVFEADAIHDLGLLEEGDESYLWLPLAHVFGKVLVTAQLRVGIPSTIDGRMERLLDNLPVIRPTLMAGVPRIFEKMYNRMVEGARAKGPVAYRVFRWAVDTGRAVAEARRTRAAISPLLALRHRIADALVLSKIRGAFGGRVRFFTSGSAPLSRDIAEFFHAVGLLIIEGYGLTESGAGSCMNRPDAYRFGTVGKPLPGVDVKIAGDGEILLRSRGLMRGYRNLPEATAQALDAGWLRTGDIGEVDADGYLRITDRKKDLIKTSGGKYVSPQNIEGQLRLACPLISHALVHGEARNFCVALLTLDAGAVRAWAERSAVNPPAGGDWATHPPVRAALDQVVADLNARLPRHETLKAIHVLSEDFTVASGELTTSMKMRRRSIEDKHRALLDRFYAGSLEAL